ncbi:unnamed protein product [Trichobilharzia szidati]|nr:unnamed protein product [Trichobilharzia szidati]
MQIKLLTSWDIEILCDQVLFMVTVTVSRLCIELVKQIILTVFQVAGCLLRSRPIMFSLHTAENTETLCFVEAL